MPRSTLTQSVGLTSSSSGDGVEAAIIETDGQEEIHPLGGVSLPYDSQLRWRILEATQNDLPTTEILRLEKKLTQHHLNAFKLLKDSYPKEVARATLLGFQGHTLRHMPSEGLTLQIGNAWLLAEGTGLPVVSDFRRHDMAIGGQGGPLGAMFHRALMARQSRPTLMLSLGSVATVTWLSKDDEIIAGDTGPGVSLINEWVQEMAEVPHDSEGRIAIEGKVDPNVVEEALSSPFFSRSLPKSADRYEFDHIDVAGLSVPDGAATLCQITVESFVRAVKKLPEVPDEVWLTGRGSQHKVIRQMLAEHFKSVKDVSELGLNPLTMAAECFAWLAVRHTKGMPITIPETTGCRSADCAGFMTSEEKASDN